MNFDSKVYYINNTDDHPFTWLKNLPVYLKDNLKFGPGYVESVSVTTNLHEIKGYKNEPPIDFKAIVRMSIKFSNGQEVITTADSIIYENNLSKMAKLLYN